MANNPFPELEGWDEINSDPGTIGAGINKAIHKLTISIANLRSATSSQLGYLQNKIGRLQSTADRLNRSFDELNENIKKAEKSSTALARALNKLTFFGVSVAFLGVGMAIIQFLFENKIWPFTG